LRKNLNQKLKLPEEAQAIEEEAFEEAQEEEAALEPEAEEEVAPEPEAEEDWGLEEDEVEAEEPKKAD
jgi:hypothetical protein